MKINDLEFPSKSIRLDDNVLRLRITKIAELATLFIRKMDVPPDLAFTRGDERAASKFQQNAWLQAQSWPKPQSNPEKQA